MEGEKSQCVPLALDAPGRGSRDGGACKPSYAGSAPGGGAPTLCTFPGVPQGPFSSTKGPQSNEELVCGTVEGPMEEKNWSNVSILNRWKCKLGEIIEVFGGFQLQESSVPLYGCNS